VSRKKKCKLCKVKKKAWEEERFFGINCRKHFVPLIVLKEHRDKLTKNEYEELLYLIDKYHPGHIINKTLSDSEEHCHIHLLKKG